MLYCVGMPDVFTKDKRSEVMSLIKGKGNKLTEGALIKITRNRDQEVIRIAEHSLKKRDRKHLISRIEKAMAMY